MTMGSSHQLPPRKTPELKMTGETLANFYADLCANYPLITIEDPFDQERLAAPRWIQRGRVKGAVGRAPATLAVEPIPRAK